MSTKPKILFADDDINIVKSLTDFLSEDYNVDSVYNGKEVLSYLEENNYQIDLLLLDIMMPELDGFEVLKKIKKSNLPVLILSARTNVFDKIKGLKLGAWGYMSKPFNEEELLAQINTLVKLGNSLKEQKKNKEMEKYGRTLAEKLATTLEQKLIMIKKELLASNSNIDSYKLGKRKYNSEDLFDDIIESQRSIINLLSTQIKDLQTLLSFYFANEKDIGLDDQFNSIKSLIDELFELSESLPFYKIG